MLYYSLEYKYMTYQVYDLPRLETTMQTEKKSSMIVLSESSDLQHYPAVLSDVVLPLLAPPTPSSQITSLFCQNHISLKFIPSVMLK